MAVLPTYIDVDENWLLSEDTYKVLPQGHYKNNVERLFKEKYGNGYHLFYEYGMDDMFYSKIYLGNVDIVQHLVLLWAAPVRLLVKAKQFETIDFSTNCMQFLSKPYLNILEKMQEYVLSHREELIQDIKEYDSNYKATTAATKYYSKGISPHIHPELLVPIANESLEGDELGFWVYEQLSNIIPFSEFYEWGCMKQTPDIADCFIMYGKRLMKEHLAFSKKVQEALLECYASETKNDIYKQQICKAIRDTKAVTLHIITVDDKTFTIKKADLLYDMYHTFYHLNEFRYANGWCKYSDVQKITYRKKVLYEK